MYVSEREHACVTAFSQHLFDEAETDSCCGSAGGRHAALHPGSAGGCQAALHPGSAGGRHAALHPSHEILYQSKNNAHKLESATAAESIPHDATI